MLREVKTVLQGAALVCAVTLAGPAVAGQTAGAPSVQAAGDNARTTGAEPGSARIQMASSHSRQTANLPVGTIRLRVIPRVGGRTLREDIKWVVETYGRDEAGHRVQVAEVTGPTPELVLPAGWYVVHADTKAKTIKHPVEVTANRIFKYTLVQN